MKVQLGSEIFCKCELDGNAGLPSHQLRQPIMHTLTWLYRLFLHQNAVVRLYVNIVKEQYIFFVSVAFSQLINSALLCYYVRL